MELLYCIQKINIYFKLIIILFLFLIHTYYFLKDNIKTNHCLESSFNPQKFKIYNKGVLSLIGLTSSITTLKNENLGNEGKQLSEIIAQKQIQILELEEKEALLKQKYSDLIDIESKIKTTKNIEYSNLQELQKLTETQTDNCKKELQYNLENLPSNLNINTSEYALPQTKIQDSSIYSDLFAEFHSLNGIKQMAVSLLLLKSALFSSFISIIFIFYGDYLINKYNLEVRFPKVANIIKLRKKYTRYYLISNFLFIFIIILAEVVFSLFLLTI